MADDTIEEGIVDILTGASNVTNLVATRVYPIIAPQDASLPYLTFQCISANRDHTFDGPSGFCMSRYQINCWATTYNVAKDCLEAVRKTMDGYSGTVANRNVQCIHSENEGDMINKTPGTDVIDRYGKRFDVIISFDEPTS